jgi:hypothetical protein
LQFCREQLPDRKIFSLDILKDDVAGISYDLLISVQVLEHLVDDVLALKQMRQMCRRYTLVSVPGGKLDDNGRENGHYRHYTKADLTEKMEQAGFRVIRAFTCGWPMHSLFYRQLMRHVPRSATNKVGLGPYTPARRKLMDLADLAYRLNLNFVGTEVFAIGVPADQPSSAVSGSPRRD